MINCSSPAAHHSSNPFPSPWIFARFCFVSKGCQMMKHPTNFKESFICLAYKTQNSHTKKLLLESSSKSSLLLVNHRSFFRVTYDFFTSVIEFDIFILKIYYALKFSYQNYTLLKRYSKKLQQIFLFAFRKLTKLKILLFNSHLSFCL